MKILRTGLSGDLREKTIVLLGIRKAQIASPRVRRQKPPRLLCAGRLLYWKGVHIAVQAFEQFILRHHEMKSIFSMPDVSLKSGALWPNSGIIKKTGLNTAQVASSIRQRDMPGLVFPDDASGSLARRDIEGQRFHFV
jgi:hypothetical protein